MAVSYVSSTLKSTPYVLPVNLDLMSKVLSFKEQNFKTNASKIQNQINTIQSTDLIKSQDKEYLDSKINNVVTHINNLGGLDLGDYNVSNNLSQLTSDIYSDKDILESIASTQKIRSLQNQYQKMQTDPKLKGSFATQNYTYDMQYVNSWLNNGERTTSDTGYNGPSTPTPYVDIDKAAIEAAKNVKANYTKSTTSDGLYIHNITKEEVTADQIKSEIKSTLFQNPQYQNQAKINSWYLNPNITGEDLYNQTLNRATVTKDRIQKDYLDYKKIYDLATPEQKLLMTDNLNIKEKNLKAYQNTISEIKNGGYKEFEKNKDAYRTNEYIENLTDHLSNTFSYNKSTDEAKPDLAKLGFMKIQESATKDGLDIVYDPTQPSGYSFVPNKNFNTSGSKSKSSSENSQFDLSKEGHLIYNLNTDDKSKLKLNDEKATSIIIDNNSKKQTLFVDLVNDLFVSHPELKETYGSVENLINSNKSKNNPNEFEIEDLQDATYDEVILKNKNTKGTIGFDILDKPTITKKQSEYISDLWNNFQNIQNGQPSRLQFTPGQLSKLIEIQNINNENEFYSELRNKSMGISNELSSYERNLLADKNNKLPNYTYGSTKNGIRVIESASATNKMQGLDLIKIKKGDSYVLVPADGRDHSFSNITIPASGIPVNYGLPLPKNNGAVIKADEIDPNALYKWRILSTQKEVDYSKALSKNKLSVKDENAYDIIDKTFNYFNYALPSDIESQKKNGTLNQLKFGIIQEAELGSNDIKTATNKTGKMLFPKMDLEKSYITRIGTSSNDPFKIEAEVAVVDSKGTLLDKVIKPLRPDEISELGVSLPNKSQLIEKAMLDLNKVTKPILFKPQFETIDNQLVLPVEIVKTSENEYIPRVKIPINGKMTSVLMSKKFNTFIPNIVGSSPSETKQLIQNFLNLAYTQAGVKTNEQLYSYLLDNKK